MLVTGLNPAGEMVTVSNEIFYTKDRTAMLAVTHEQGCTYRGRVGSTYIKPRVYIRIVTQDKTNVNPAWNGFPNLDAAKAALRALSSDGRIYDEEGWDGVVVNGEVVLY